MSARYDFVAFNEKGAYALSEDDGSAGALSFVREMRRRGHRVERLPVAEACEAHKAYLKATWPAFAEMMAAREAGGKP